MDQFYPLLAKWARAKTVAPGDVLFSDGLDMSSINFLEFIMELESVLGVDIDVEKLDASIKTAGQLHDRIAATLA